MCTMQDETAINDPKPQIPPPSGTPKQAEKYITQLIDLINADRLEVIHTDLSKFDPSNLQDHYKLELQDYSVEISHSKNPNNGNDSYILLFTNLKNVRDGCTEKIILAYMHLDLIQFKKFIDTSDLQTQRKKRKEEEKRLKEAMLPIDQALENIVKDTLQETDNSQVNPQPQPVNDSFSQQLSN